MRNGTTTIVRKKRGINSSQVFSGHLTSGDLTSGHVTDVISGKACAMVRSSGSSSNMVLSVLIYYYGLVTKKIAVGNLRKIIVTP
jgi:hypothetical protein